MMGSGIIMLPPNLAKPHAGQQGVVEEFRKVLPMGIGCEDCHGPGAAHIAEMKAWAANPSYTVEACFKHPRCGQENSTL